MLALILISTALAGAPLEGTWRAVRHFGPDVRGPLEVARGPEGAWRAQIAGFDVAAAAKDGRISFALPQHQGRFDGRLGSRIRGHWFQPVGRTDGSEYASPVALEPRGKDRWRGEVVPYDDDFTLYLFISRKPDGTLTAWLRNPDRNLGLQWADLERVEVAGASVRLLGKGGRAIAEGTFHPDEPRLTLDLPNRGGAYDFLPAPEGYVARSPEPWTYRPPPAEDDGWKVGRLEEVGLSVEPLKELVQKLSEPQSSVHDLDVHGLLIARHGKLVFEEYLHGYGRDLPHDTRSAAKAATAVLVGAAMQSGVKLSLDTRIYDLLQADTGGDDRKKAMTVEHLLTMSPGYDCNDWVEPLRPGSEERLLNEMPPDLDWYKFTLALPLEGAPGSFSAYCSINPHLLGAVLAKASGRPVLDLFQDLVAEPLGLRRYHIGIQRIGAPFLGGSVKFLPRDFMKLGQMELDGGVWNGRRVLSAEFAKQVGTVHTTLRGMKPDTHYGYLWWTITLPYRGRTVEGFFASGNGGQTVVVIRELDMVVATWGGNYADRAGWTMVRENLPKYVLAAVKDPAR